MASNQSKRILPSPAKMLKGVKTLNDLMARDGVNGILRDLDENKPHIGDMVVIYLDKRTNNFVCQITDGTPFSTANWMLDSIKYGYLLAPDEDD